MFYTDGEGRGSYSNTNKAAECSRTSSSITIIDGILSNSLM
jgi:hypothetical protein